MSLPLVHGAEMRIAETRAVNRALRKAYGIGAGSSSIHGRIAPIRQANRSLRPSRYPPRPRLPMGTATSLAASPTQCAANLFATGITAGGNANCSQPEFSQLSGSVGGTQLSGTYSNSLTLTGLLTAAGMALTPLGQATTTQAFNSTPIDLQASSYNTACRPRGHLRFPLAGRADGE
jgi:hypothetical protein